MSTERTYINGLYFQKKYPKSPSFVLGRGSIDPQRLREFLDKNPLPEGEKYINFQILEVKGNTEKGTFVVDTWKPEKKEINTDEQQRKHDEKKAKEVQEQIELNELREEYPNPTGDIPF